MPRHKSFRSPKSPPTPGQSKSPGPPPTTAELPDSPPAMDDPPVHSPSKSEPILISVPNHTASHANMGDIRDLLRNVPTATGTDLDILIQFLLEIENVSQFALVPFHILLKSLGTKTDGPLRQWWRLNVYSELEWTQLKNLILNHFTTSIDRAMLIERYISRRQNLSENFPEYAEDVLKYVELLGPSLSESEIIARIWLNQNEFTFNYLQFRDTPTCLAELHQLIKHLRVVERQRKTYTHPNSTGLVAPNFSPCCRYCKQPGHFIAQCPVRPPRPSPSEPKAILPSQG